MKIPRDPITYDIKATRGCSQAMMYLNIIIMNGYRVYDNGQSLKCPK